jgi:phage tail sheath protein FI
MAKVSGSELRENDQSTVVTPVTTQRGAIVLKSLKGKLNERVLCTTTRDFRSKYGNEAVGYYGHYAAIVALDQMPVYVVRTADADDLPKYGGVSFGEYGSSQANAAFTVGVTTPSTYSFGADEVMIITGANPGAWNNTTKVILTHDDDDSEVFWISVYVTDSDGNYFKAEEFECSRVTTKKNGYGSSIYVEDAVNDVSKYIWVTDNTAIAGTSLPNEQLTQLALAYGDNGTDPEAADIASAWSTYFSNKTDVSFTIAIAGGWSDSVVANMINNICGTRQDCHGVLDQVNSTVLATITANKATWSLVYPSYTHSYAPWVKFKDTTNDKLIELPPSGFVAQAVARKNNEAKIWDATFGKERGILPVQGLVVNFDEDNQQLLVDSQINPITQDPKTGVYINGGYTNQVALSARSWVNIRELLNEDEQAVLDFLDYYRGKNNTSFNRAGVTTKVEKYFRPRKGDNNGYYDVAVVCNDDNNDATAIENGYLYVDIYMQPVRPINRILLTAIIKPTGVSLTEGTF